MKAGGGRLKGNAYERKIAKMIIKAFAHCGITRKDCYRTPASGGHRQARETDGGDLVMSTRLVKYFPFVAECKHYRTLDWHLLLSPAKNSHWLQWWMQAKKAAKPIGLQPIVIFQKNRCPSFAMLRWSAVDKDFWKTVPRIKAEVGVSPVQVVLFKHLLDYMARKTV